MFLQILSGNHHLYVVAVNDLCDLEIEVKVTRFKLGLRLAQACAPVYQIW